MALPPQQIPGGGVMVPLDRLMPAVDLPTGRVQPPAETDTRPERPSLGAVVDAAFENENSIVSTLNYLDTLDDTTERQAGYSAWADIQGTPYEDHWESFVDSRSPARTAALKRLIDEEQENDRTLAASGAQGVIASIFAGIADPTVLIPVGGEMKLAANGSWSIGRSVLSGARAGLVGSAIQEGILQSTQETRTAEESAINIGSSVVLGSLMTGSVAALLTRSEQQSAARALENMARGAGQPTSAGAAAVDRATISDLTPSSAVGFGRAAERLASVTQTNPNMRAQFRASPAARQYSQELAENTLYQTMHDRGDTLGAAVETLARSNFNARQFTSVRAHNAIFSEAKKAGLDLNRQQFEEAVGRALRNGDEDANPFIQRAAEQWRKNLFEPFKNEAIDLGLLPPDVSVQTAESYFTRVWNKELLTAREPEFKDRVTSYYEGLLAQENAQAAEALARRQGAVDQEVADLRLGPEDRLRVLGELEAAGAKLDSASADEVDRVSVINDLRREQRAAREAGNPARVAELQSRIEAEQSAGGERLKSYMADRRRLRARRKRVDLNYAGMNERYDGIMQSLVDLEEGNIRSLNRIVDKGRAFEREFQRLDPEKLQSRIQDLRGSFYSVSQRADAAADRAGKALAKMDEQAAKAVEAGTPVNEATAARDAAARARTEKEIAAQRGRAERMASLARRLEAAETFDVNASLLEVRQSVDALVNEVSNLSLARGEKAARLKSRLETLDTKLIDDRIRALDDAKGAAVRDFDERWGPKTNATGAGFSEAARQIADDVFDKLTGRAAIDSGGLLPEYLTPIVRGPLKDRTFNIPDKLVEDFLDSNVLSVAERYGRTMAGETELARRFGRADMREQVRAIRDDYRGMREAVAAQRNGAEAVQALPDETRAAFVEKGGKQPSVEKVLKFLREDETGAIRDLEAMRDLIRGTYKATENASNYGRVVRSLMAFNYLRSMGGAVFANWSELYRPAMVHGLRAYMQEGVAPLLKNMSAVKMSVEEAQLAGQVTERVLQNRIMSMGEVGDPYRSGTAVERMLQNGTRVASRWNGLVYWTDGVKAISSILSQNRILAGAGGEGDQRFLAYLGINKEMGGRISEQFARHGETMDNVRVANTENWTDAEAVRAYRAAVSKDVDSIIVTKSVGDVPLFVNTPTGKMIAQFRNYAFSSHQRVLLRGLQEDKKRFVSGIVGMSALGAMGAWARSWRGGRERHEKFLEAASNPGYLIAEGLDLSGIFALPIEAANTVEKLTGPSGFSFNPIKTPLMAAGAAANPGASMQGSSVRFANRDPLSAVLGPSAGLPVQVARAAGAVGSAVTGEEVKPSEANALIGLIPYGSYLGMREMLQATTGDSPYAPQQ